MFGIIYKAVNKINNKVYIGQTVKLLKIRIIEHINSKDNCYFHKAIRKYGKDNFEWEIIEECESKAELDEMEFHYIKQYNSFGIDGYNLTFGGLGNSGRKFDDKYKLKQSELKKRLFRNKTNHPMYGKNHSQESKDKMSSAVEGKNHNRWGKFGSDNPAAKKYIITTPKGQILIIKGLHAFCKQNNLFVSNMSACAVGKRKTHKNYKCSYYK